MLIADAIRDEVAASFRSKKNRFSGKLIFFLNGYRNGSSDERCNLRGNLRIKVQCWILRLQHNDKRVFYFSGHTVLARRVRHHPVTRYTAICFMLSTSAQVPSHTSECTDLWNSGRQATIRHWNRRLRLSLESLRRPQQLCSRRLPDPQQIGQHSKHGNVIHTRRICNSRYNRDSLGSAR